MQGKEAVLIHVTTAGVHLPTLPVPMSAYLVSKIASVKMMEYFAAENEDVRVMLVHPGVHDTVQAEKLANVGFAMPFDDCEL